MHPFFNEIKHPSIKVNKKSLPNIFNFTPEEIETKNFKDNYIRLVPNWYKEK
jgi:hypothetical protein